MEVLWQILVQFIFRLSFGLAFGMAVTPSRLVTSGFFRVHLWVLMGVNTLAVLALYSNQVAFETRIVSWPMTFGCAIGLVVLSYAGAVFWLYEGTRSGAFVLFVVALVALLAAVSATPGLSEMSLFRRSLICLDSITGGLLVGMMLAAMFLGHWYLNTPTMQLLPLNRLINILFAAILLRAVVCGVGLGMVISAETVPSFNWIFLVFRWLSGFVGAFSMAWLAWLTLKIPNTQSATGILYAGVTFVFIGELVSLLLSVDQLYPL